MDRALKVICLFVCCLTMNSLHEDSPQASELGVGEISQSSQAEYERIDGTAFVGMASSTLQNQSLINGDYLLKMNEATLKTWILGARVGMSRIGAGFLLQGEYAVGISSGSGVLQPMNYSISESSSSLRLFSFDLRPRALFVYEDWGALQPFAGAGIQAFYYRYASELMGSDFVGHGLRLAPALGFQLNGFPVRRLAFSLGATRPITLTDRQKENIAQQWQPELSAGLTF